MEQEKKNVTFDFRNVPPTYIRCFLTECPKREECLRYLAGQHLDDKYNFGHAIYPNIKIGENGCQFFKTGEPQLMAWGFNTLFEEVKRKHTKPLHEAMHKYLGATSNYYRYHHGERLLSPEQQAWIIDLFKRYGYAENLQFDHYTYCYDFDH